MTFDMQSVVMFIIGQLITGAAIWGGIRSDIKALHEKAATAKDAADKAHERIDTLLTRHGR